ncbi:MAG: sulfotransferase [Burkholderiales bacterium]
MANPPRLLFTSGTARGGTNFRTLILDGHPQIRMSLDPFIPLFRFYRDSLLASVGESGLLQRLESGVLDDYYFNDTKRRIMQLVQSADPDIPFDPGKWDQLRDAIASRMTLASVNLIPHLAKLPAPTFREVFNNTVSMVAEARGGTDLVWAGFNDNWAMEFFRPLAQLIPEAKFMLHLRDPRGVVHSSEFAEPDPRKRPTVVSFARHLRKYFAFASVLPNDPLMKGRLLVTGYEPFLENPESEVRRMTDFLGLDYVPDMIDVSRFRKADGSPWQSDWAIYKSSADIWRRECPEEMAELTEFICDPEMRMHGYKPELYDRKNGLSAKAFDFALRNSRECLGWRTDFREIEQTIGCEFFRKRILESGSELDDDTIGRCFLFADVLKQLKAMPRD